jgi:hypothetical protein
MRRTLGPITVVIAVSAVVSALVGAATAVAGPRTVAVPVTSYESRLGSMPGFSSLVRVRVRIPRGGRVWPVADEDPSAAGVVVRRGDCTARFAIGAELDEPRKGGAAGTGSPLRRSRAIVTDLDGRRRGLTAWSRAGTDGETGARAALTAVRLPATILPGSPFRDVVVYAFQAAAGARCGRSGWDAILRGALRVVDIGIIAPYLPDDPAPLIDVARVPHLTIGGTGLTGGVEAGGSSVGDTDGDGRPELGLAVPSARTEGPGELRLVNVGPLTGSISISDPAATTTRLRPFALDTIALAAGDLNGDGLSDLLLERGGIRSDNAVTAVLGRRGGGTVALDDPASAYLTVVARSGCGAGLGATSGTTAPGDLDGDGHPDLVVAATDCAADAGDGRGPDLPERLWLVSGQGRGGTVVLGTSRRARVLAELPDAAGVSAFPIGDVNGDGLADLATSGNVGDRGSWVGVLFSSATDTTPVQAASAAGRGVVVRSATCAGLRTAGPVGDVNGDGFADLIVNGSDECGADVPFGAVLFGGPATGRLAPEQIVATGRGLSIDAWVGPAGGDRDGDGLADLVASDGELAYVIGGRSTPGPIVLRRLGTTGRRVRADVGHTVGGLMEEVVALPDADGDGRPELAIGASDAPFGGHRRQGAVYVLGSRAG